MLKCAFTVRNRAHRIQVPGITGVRAIMSIVAVLLVMTTTLAADIVSAHHPDHEQHLPDDTPNPVVGIPPNAGRIIGTPEPGPPPTHQGDRGGHLQLATLAALIVGVGFIAWRVSRATHARSG